MKKYLLISGFILSLLLLVCSPQIVKAQDPTETPEPTSTITPTLIIEPFYSTSTPMPLGNCPVDGCVVDNNDLTYEYKQKCGLSCICTKTPSFPTITPEGFISSPTPTKTSTPAMGGVRVSNLNDFSTLLNANQEYHYENLNWSYTSPYNVAFNSDTPNIQGVEYKTGYRLSGQGYLKNGTSTEELYLKISNKNNLNSLFIDWYGSDVHTDEVLPGETLQLTLFSNPDGGYWTVLKSFDIRYTRSTTTSLLLDYSISTGHKTYTSGNQDSWDFIWYDGGTFNFERTEGYCSIPDYKSDHNTNDIFQIAEGYWIGVPSCQNFKWMTNFLNSEVVQDLLYGQDNPQVLFPDVEICVRGFYYSDLVLLGMHIDINMLLYMIVGMWTIKNLIGLVGS